MTTLQRIQECIHEASGGIPVEEITAEAHLYDDLGLDSLDMADLMLDLEGEFDTDIPTRDAHSFRTVQDSLTYIQEVQA